MERSDSAWSVAVELLEPMERLDPVVVVHASSRIE
jgi:hypothetical protein